jgi:hypothetical protein
MPKRSLLIGFTCLAVGCNLYDELGVPAYDSLQGPPHDADWSAEPDEPAWRSDAGFAAGGGDVSESPDGPSPESGHAGAAADGGVDAGVAAPVGASGRGGHAAQPTAGSGAAAGSGGAGGASAGAGGAAAGSGGMGGASAGAGGGAAGGAAGVGGAAGSGGAGGAAGSGGTGGASAGAGGAGGASGTTDPECAADGGQTWSGNGHCYFPLLTQTAWNMSRDACGHAGAKLASITSLEELNFVAGLLEAGPAWIGLSKFGTPDFHWSTGEVSSYTHWAAGEPNINGEAAVAMRHDTHEWFDDVVIANYRAICER